MVKMSTLPPSKVVPAERGKKVSGGEVWQSRSISLVTCCTWVKGTDPVEHVLHARFHRCVDVWPHHAVRLGADLHGCGQKTRRIWETLHSALEKYLWQTYQTRVSRQSRVSTTLCWRHRSGCISLVHLASASEIRKKSRMAIQVYHFGGQQVVKWYLEEATCWHQLFTRFRSQTFFLSCGLLNWALSEVSQIFNDLELMSLPAGI